jgi:hypothetical protein
MTINYDSQGAPNTFGPLDEGTHLVRIDGRWCLTMPGVRAIAELLEDQEEAVNDGSPCRVCGCTNEQACIGRDRTTDEMITCSWVHNELCSRCAGSQPDVEWITDLDIAATDASVSPEKSERPDYRAMYGLGDK